MFVVCGWVSKATAKMDRTNESFSLGSSEEVGKVSLNKQSSDGAQNKSGSTAV